MKHFLKPFIVIFSMLIMVTGCNGADAPKQGKHYTVLPTAITNAPQVLEVFSFGCGHCRTMETIIPEMEKQTNTKIEKMHATFDRGSQMLAFMYYTAVIQTEGKPSEKFMDDLFGYIQEPSNTSEEERKSQLKNTYKNNNLKTPYALSDSEQKEVVAKMEYADKVMQESQLNAIPAFIVGGKYLVNTGAHESIEDISTTISHLLTL
ncbi:thiol:disulfide interchange protein DsbA/DsbL [Photobacterium swingsii]|uniref:thiol:disulfide interchange protein DsbA/DsbL n=1 Tax=Photobacterium swingsii TaxID=680026 RepID=UPI00354E8C16